MNRVAVFVDAGYLYAGGSTSISGASKKRTELILDVAATVQFLSRKAESLTGVGLLRIYWYDGALSNRLATDHQLLASSDNVKLRLGVINGAGEQKGVDAKIITDMADLARNAAFSDAVLFGGDEDLRIGVELAQERGARVHLLIIEGSSSSPTLRQEADTVSVLTRSEIETFLSLAAPLAPMPLQGSKPTLNTISISSNPDVTTLLQGVQAYLGALNESERNSLRSAIEVSNNIPAEHDGRLLARGREALNRPLASFEKIAVREEIRRLLDI